MGFHCWLSVFEFSFFLMFLSCFVWLITFSFLVFYTLIFILLNISLVSVLTLRNLFYDCRVLSRPDTFLFVSTASCAVHSFLVSVRSFLHPRPSGAGVAVAAPGLSVDSFATGAEPAVLLSQHLLHGVSRWPNFSFFLGVDGSLVTAPLVAPKRMLSLTTSLAAFPPRLLAPPFHRAVVSCSQLCASVSRWRQPSGHGSERLEVAGAPVALSLALRDGRVLQGWAGGAQGSSEPVTGELHGHSLFPGPPHGFRLGRQNAVLGRRRCASLSQDPAVSRDLGFWVLASFHFAVPRISTPGPSRGTAKM